MIYPSQKLRVWHIPLKRGSTTKGGGVEIIKVLSEECVQRGVKVLNHTRAKRIIRGAKGNITRVEAEKGRRGISDQG